MYKVPHIHTFGLSFLCLSFLVFVYVVPVRENTQGLNAYEHVQTAFSLTVFLLPLRDPGARGPHVYRHDVPLLQDFSADQGPLALAREEEHQP